MGPFNAFAVLISITALFSYLNARVLRLPPVIGVMVAALCSSLALFVFGAAGLGAQNWATALLNSFDFNELLMEGMLSFLLFAGSLHVDLSRLTERKWTILSLATVGIVTSTFLVGTATWLIFGWLGFEVPYLYALLFGAIISPTDPIAVLGILRRAGAEPAIEDMITGESLFNDGVGVVLFLMILEHLTGYDHGFSLSGAGLFFLREAVGGVLLGLVVGYLAYRLLKSLDDYVVEVLITIALVSGGYALAGLLHVSGPLAMVSAGLLIGNHGRLFAMSEKTRLHLDNFWELIDEILNALLFVLIGLEFLVLDLSATRIAAGLLVIPAALGARLVSVAGPVTLLRLKKTFPPFTIAIMTWGGLRGGISIALALSLPPSGIRDLVLVATYAVVVFSILVQGLSVGRLAGWARSRLATRNQAAR